MKFILLEECGFYAKVTLNRPEIRNAFNPDMIKEITLVFKSLAKRKDIRCVVLTGEGKSFCAGADVNWMKEMVKYSLLQNKKDSEKLFDMFQAIYSCPLPVIAFAKGAAFGGALGLLACCDMVAVSEDCQFAFSEVKLGISPAVISHFVLQKTTLGQAMPWMLSGKTFSAKEAQWLGLAHIICKNEEISNYEIILAALFKETGVEAVQETKKLLQKMKGLSPAKAKLATTKVIAKRRASKEGQEGLKAFLEKRSPSWRLS